jgi:hydroxymethylbilane synthase
MTKALTVATRRGDLAVAQTNIVISALKRIYPHIKVRTKKIVADGDRDRETSLWNLKDSGFFTSKVEQALLKKKADFAVHSFKDLPTHQQKGLQIAAVCGREFAEDCLIAAEKINSIDELQHAAKIGTSSLRRAVQIKRLRADLQILPIRGNVLTRIRLLEAGEFDAIVLARAGVERLGLGSKISVCFDQREFVPAPAQGVLAVQIRSDDISTRRVVGAIDDWKSRAAAFAERQILVKTRCGCHAPVGAFAEIKGGDIEIFAFISDLQGQNFIKRQIAGPAVNTARLAEKLADELLDAGGREILEKLENDEQTKTG